MSGYRGRDGKRIARTVAYLLKCPASSVPQAMRACKLSNSESSNEAKQMAVRQAWKAALKKKKHPPPPLSNQRVVAGVGCVPNYWVDQIHDQQIQNYDQQIQNSHFGNSRKY
jgi:hypothetical protein